MQKFRGAVKNLGVDIFPDPVAILGPPSGHLGFCMWCGELGSLVPLGCYCYFGVLTLVVMINEIKQVLISTFPSLTLFYNILGSDFYHGCTRLRHGHNVKISVCVCICVCVSVSVLTSIWPRIGQKGKILVGSLAFKVCKPKIMSPLCF